MPAKKFATQIDLQKIPVLGLRPESSSTEPANPAVGQLWVDTSASPHRLKVYENGGWVLVSEADSELKANKGQANGYASLDGSALVPYTQLPVGSTSSTVAAGDDSRLSNSRTPTGSAGGSLSGTYPNPSIATGAVGGTEVSSDIKDPAANVAGLRTLGTGSQQALAGDTRLDTIASPTGSVSLNSQKITNLAAPTNASDAATKGYVDGVATGLDVKASARAASTANVTVSYNATNGTSTRGQITSAPQTLDGVTLVNGDRVLLKNQTAGAQNGIWVVTTAGSGSSGVWDRAEDFDSDSEVTAGAFVFVEEGTANADTGWVMTTDNPITIGGASGTALVWAQFSGAGTYIAGDGLTLDAKVFNVHGTSGRISVSADAIDIDTSYAGQSSITTVGTISTGTWNGTTIAVANGGTGATTADGARANLGATTKYAATLGALTAGVELSVVHNLNTEDVVASFREVSTGYDVVFNWRVIDEDTIGVTADVAISASAIRAVVVG